MKEVDREENLRVLPRMGVLVEVREVRGMPVTVWCLEVPKVMVLPAEGLWCRN